MSKEKLPLTLITSLISQNWSSISDLKAQIESINKTFSETASVVDVLQNLIDSHLVCISQLESYLTDNKYVKKDEDNDSEQAVKFTLSENSESAASNTEAIIEKFDNDSSIAPIAETFELDHKNESKNNDDFVVDFEEPKEVDRIEISEIKEWLANH